MVDAENYFRILSEAKKYNASLVAVSKTKTAEDILELHKLGQNDFGENYVKELLEKKVIASGIRWHFIGHLQTNKVKSITGITELIHGVDSLKLLREIDKEAAKAEITQDCLLQIHVAREETKFGFSTGEAEEVLNSDFKSVYKNMNLRGVMAMASNTEDNDMIRQEFRSVRQLFEKYQDEIFSIVSTGMTSDYRIALEEGSTMIRIGSAIFGSRL